MYTDLLQMFELLVRPPPPGDVALSVTHHMELAHRATVGLSAGR